MKNDRRVLRKKYEKEFDFNPIGYADEWAGSTKVSSLNYVEWLEDKIIKLEAK